MLSPDPLRSAGFSRMDGKGWVEGRERNEMEERGRVKGKEWNNAPYKLNS